MIPVKISGIPCLVEIYYLPECKGSYSGGLQVEPDEPASWEILMVYDRGGYPAPWLERKLRCSKAMLDVEEQINEHIKQSVKDVYNGK